MESEQLRFWRRLVWLAAGLHALVILALALTRLYTHKAAMVDLGFYDQAVWTTATTGTPTISMYPPYDVRHFFTLHFVPLLLALAPIYRVLPLESLLAAQALLIAISAVVLFHAIVRMKVEPKTAFIWTLVYLLNPFLMSGAVWDFRERALALPLFATAYYALLGRNRVLFGVALTLLALCQEHFGLAIAGFGVLWLRENGREKFGMAAVAGGLLVLVIVAFVMSGLRPAADATALVGGQLHAARYDWLVQPSVWAPALSVLIPDGVQYGFFYLAAPLVGLSLFSPWFLMPGIADLAANLLSLNPMPRSPFAYHSMTLVPVLLIAAVRTSSRWAQPARWAGVALVSTLVFCWTMFPAALPGAANIWQIDSVVLRRDPALVELERLVPASMSLSVENGIGPFFSRRRLVYLFPAKVDEVDAVVLHLDYPYRDVNYAPFSIPYAAHGDVSEIRDDVLPAIERLVGDPKYGLVYWERNWLLAVRGAQDTVDRNAVQQAVAAYRREFARRN